MRAVLALRARDDATAADPSFFNGCRSLCRRTTRVGGPALCREHARLRASNGRLSRLSRLHLSQAPLFGG